MLKIYNTLTRQKDAFAPIIPGEVRMYVCGPTVYNFIHIGNARTFTVFDMVARWLKSPAHNYKVTYVRNFTDVDDKIIERAAENNESIDALSRRMIAAMREDCRRLGLEAPTHEPYATEHVSGMVNMVEALVGKGLAYPAVNGDVFYAVHKFPGYGKLSGKSLDDLRAGERVGVDAAKRDPLDFVLWKAAKPGEPSWPSPWGPGRPGWHIECSVMSEALLGQHFDIHGGGEDLQFPHHENEIAQSEGVHDHPFVNYWMHAAFLNMADKKMSKSLGNVSTARDVLDRYRGQEEAIRFFLLRGHYRSQLGFTEDALKAARKELESHYIALRNTPPMDVKVDWEHPYAARFKAAMDDDFNTWAAFTVLSELRHEVSKTASTELSGMLKALGGTLGFLQQPAASGSGYLAAESAIMAGQGTLNRSREYIEERIAVRNAARKAKSFAEADRIREELDQAGIVLEDKTVSVTEWRRK